MAPDYLVVVALLRFDCIRFTFVVGPFQEDGIRPATSDARRRRGTALALDFVITSVLQVVTIVT